MARQEEGWPLGLQPLNARVGIAGNGDFSGSRSFNTLLTVSSSTDSSSDLDTESTGSFFHDRSVTLGSLIGVSNILELSRKSTRTRKVEVAEDKKSCKPKTWIFSLCSRDTTDAKISVNNYTPSLGHLLAVERRAAGEYRRNHSHVIYGSHDELELAQPVTEPNSLFVNGHVAPPRLNQSSGAGAERIGNEELEHCSSGYGVPVLFSCMCGQPSL
ncbi:60S Ribosomal protein [Salix suchowensis]|nr:60S Ribosomal protein [Salix suchowensis]